MALEDSMIPEISFNEITVSSITENEAYNSSACSQRVFYELAADTSVKLSDNITLQFNKAMLCGNAGSEVFLSMFFGPLRDEVTKIEDIDSETFKLFLDCVMKYSPLSFQIAYKILPVAWKYQSNAMIDSCLNALQPPEMNETVIDLLNMAVLFNFENLINQILIFIMNDYNPYKLLDSDEYRELLSPGSIKKILSELEIVDSYVLQNVINWAKNHLERNHITYENIKDFLKSVDLLKFFKISAFETSGSLHDFLMLEKKFFSFEEVINILKCPDIILQKNSEWIKKRANTTITETIVLTCKEHFRDSAHNFFAIIKRNRMVCYENGRNQLKCALKLKQLNRCGQTILEQEQLEFDVLREVEPGTYAFPIIRVQNSVPGYRCVGNQVQLSDTRLFRLYFSITYIFPAECRILRTNRPGDGLNISMYFTGDISCSLF